ncbi:MAG: hypothetical protein ACI8WT_000121 [Clostridium sp.]
MKIRKGDRMNEILNQIELPKIVKVKQTFTRPKLYDIEKEIRAKILEQKVLEKIRKGSKIAITGGSRGISNYQTIMRVIVSIVKEYGGEPFIVPAMGSHGGGTGEGQRKILAKLGITEELIGAPIISSAETVEVGISDKGLPVYVDKYAYEADGIILLNRVKLHTSFRGKYESGLVKMIAIGLGKRKGADMTHSLRFENMAENIVSMAKVSLDKLNILFGVATIENGYDETAEIHIVRKEKIMEIEPQLLERSKELMSKIYLEKIDVLIVKELGKNISGTGMDTNIIGRYHTKAASGGPDVTKLGVLDITDKSDGNANGMGLADYTTKKLCDKINFPATYLNVITSTEPNSVKLPMVLDNDKLVLQVAVKACGIRDIKKIKMVIIENTKHLDEIYISEYAMEEVKKYKNVEILGSPKEIEFDKNMNLKVF